MQSEVFLSSQGQSGRTIALRPCPGTRFNAPVDLGHALFFSLHDSTAAGLPQVAVCLEPALDFNPGLYRKIHNRPVYGCLGLIHHAKGKFL